MKSSLTIAAAFAAASATASLYNITPNNHSCVVQAEYLSCSSKANPKTAATCCTETYGGLVLATQFWNTWADKELPANTWTLHGLWPGEETNETHIYARTKTLMVRLLQWQLHSILR